MSNQLNWNENELNTERLRKVYTFINHLMNEMQDNTVPRIDRITSISFVKMAENGDIDEVTASENKNIFLYWAENTNYKKGDLRQYDEYLYKCLQAHTSQADWKPDVSTSLWKVCGIDENGVPIWSQPISSSDAYNIGDDVMFEGVHYKSLIDNNVWSPTAYPQCWEIIK